MEQARQLPIRYCVQWYPPCVPSLRVAPLPRRDPLPKEQVRHTAERCPLTEAHPSPGPPKAETSVQGRSPGTQQGFHTWGPGTENTGEGSSVASTPPLPLALLLHPWDPQLFPLGLREPCSPGSSVAGSVPDLLRGAQACTAHPQLWLRRDPHLEPPGQSETRQTLQCDLLVGTIHAPMARVSPHSSRSLRSGRSDTDPLGFTGVWGSACPSLPPPCPGAGAADTDASCTDDKRTQPHLIFRIDKTAKT